jgi:hypothetical protein
MLQLSVLPRRHACGTEVGKAVAVEIEGCVIGDQLGSKVVLHRYHRRTNGSVAVDVRGREDDQIGPQVTAIKGGSRGRKEQLIGAVVEAAAVELGRRNAHLTSGPKLNGNVLGYQGGVNGVQYGDQEGNTVHIACRVGSDKPFLIESFVAAVEGRFAEAQGKSRSAVIGGTGINHGGCNGSCAGGIEEYRKRASLRTRLDGVAHLHKTSTHPGIAVEVGYAQLNGVGAQMAAIKAGLR